MFGKAMIEKAVGNDEAAAQLVREMREEMGKHEVYFERWYEQYMHFYRNNAIEKDITRKGANSEIVIV